MFLVIIPFPFFLTSRTNYFLLITRTNYFLLITRTNYFLLITRIGCLPLTTRDILLHHRAPIFLHTRRSIRLKTKVLRALSSRHRVQTTYLFHVGIRIPIPLGTVFAHRRCNILCRSRDSSLKKIPLRSVWYLLCRGRPVHWVRSLPTPLYIYRIRYSHNRPRKCFKNTY
jgi:hypothetical protein